jgi:hypothetical protein
MGLVTSTAGPGSSSQPDTVPPPPRDPPCFLSLPEELPAFLAMAISPLFSLQQDTADATPQAGGIAIELANCLLPTTPPGGRRPDRFADRLLAQIVARHPEDFARPGPVEHARKNEQVIGETVQKAHQ